MLLETLFFLASGAGLISATLDSYSTYRGIYVLKIATEGNPSRIAQFLTSNKFLCLAGKPTAMVAIIIACHFGGTAGLIAGIVAAAGATFAGLTGFINNLSVNGGF